MMSVRSSKQFALSKGQNKTPNEYSFGVKFTITYSCRILCICNLNFTGNCCFLLSSRLYCRFWNSRIWVTKSAICHCHHCLYSCAWVADFTAGWEFILIGLFCPIRSPCPEELFFIWFFTIIMYCYLFVNSLFHFLYQFQKLFLILIIKVYGF